MKKILVYSLLAAVLFGNSGAGCSSKNSDDPQPQQITSLVGKWEAIRALYHITKQDGTTLSTGPELKSKGTVIIWEFFSDGRLKATGDIDGSTKTREVRWSLNAKRTSGIGIEEGKLTIIGKEEREFAQLIGQTGDLTYDIQTVDGINGSAAMFLEVDATKVGPYKKNILTYVYHKL
ncbi:hypothetical protein IC229_29890 [Spirosoma sp. BT702]|uniref:Lipocalin-like domain-containing protein n=1 Tax=Spirosoma profusum TaxID=2771354 RepID=A0A927AUZ3_9BACT|nr:hypothetical protein [Spirosoma profusum]MBD2704881.1 hypothetical protein [Spirosoma profusum]